MAEIRSDPTFVAGDTKIEAEYYRLHFANALVRPEHLDAMINRFRRWFRPEGIVAARHIEQRLYELTWNQETYDLLPSLGRLAAPTLVLTGAQDFIPVPIAREIAEAIPGSRFEVVPNCGHFSFMEQPDAVYAAIRDRLTATG
jgi:pimeloyl-ACP methyl ester carboxylesterase